MIPKRDRINGLFNLSKNLYSIVNIEGGGAGGSGGVTF